MLLLFLLFYCLFGAGVSGAVLAPGNHSAAFWNCYSSSFFSSFHRDSPGDSGGLKSGGSGGGF